jgi:hypothetical protein
MHFRLRIQRAEVLGQENRWYCSQKHGRRVEEEEELWKHFILYGGAAEFSRRFNEAMSDLNRWYCSESHRRDVRDPLMLWDYYTNHCYCSADRVGQLEIAC